MTAGCSMLSTNQSASVTPALANAESQYVLGRYYQGQQRYEQAIEAYRRALAANPGHVSAHNGLGASLLLTGQNAEAIEQFKTGLRHQPRSAALWNNLGYAYTLSGENKLAEFALKQSLDLDPTDIKTNTNLAMVQQGSSQATPAPAATAPATTTLALAQADTTQPGTTQIFAVPVYAASANTSPAVAAQAMPAETAMKLRPNTELAEAAISPAAVQVVEVAPRVYEMNLPDTNAASPIVAGASMPAPITGATRISIPLREAPVQTASLNSD
jgi:tetratricopeptide (TPR) repeat protein